MPDTELLALLEGATRERAESLIAALDSGEFGAGSILALDLEATKRLTRHILGLHIASFEHHLACVDEADGDTELRRLLSAMTGELDDLARIFRGALDG